MLCRTQRNYLAAKAIVETLNQAYDKYEREFLDDKGYSDIDHLWEIEDQTEFEKMGAEFDSLYSTEYAETTRAAAALKAAGDELVKMALLIAPVKTRPDLEKVAKNYTARQEMIELTVKLDIRTLPRQLRQQIS